MNLKMTAPTPIVQPLDKMGTQISSLTKETTILLKSLKRELTIFSWKHFKNSNLLQKLIYAAN